MYLNEQFWSFRKLNPLDMITEEKVKQKITHLQLRVRGSMSVTTVLVSVNDILLIFCFRLR